MNPLRVGTRGSRLAIAQTEIALDALRRSKPTLDFEVVKINTRGDTDKRPLFSMDEKGIFEKEVNDAVRKGEVDFAVHSMKDIPSDLSADLAIACIPKRAKPNDVLVNGGGLTLKRLRQGSLIGTSSLRRVVQLQKIRPDLVVRPIRGNIDTRVKKVMSGEFDSIVLAEAGLARIGLQDVISERFSTMTFMPAPGQGAIGIVCRADDPKTATMLKSIEDSPSRSEVLAERALIENVEGGCRFPLGALAKASGSKLVLSASVFSADGTKNIKARRQSSIKNPEKAGRLVAEDLVEKGAQDLAQDWRDAVKRWNNQAP